MIWALEHLKIDKRKSFHRKSDRSTQKYDEDEKVPAQDMKLKEKRDMNTLNDSNMSRDNYHENLKMIELNFSDYINNQRKSSLKNKHSNENNDNNLKNNNAEDWRVSELDSPTATKASPIKDNIDVISSLLEPVFHWMIDDNSHTDNFINDTNRSSNNNNNNNDSNMNSLSRGSAMVPNVAAGAASASIGYNSITDFMRLRQRLPPKDMDQQRKEKGASGENVNSNTNNVNLDDLSNVYVNRKVVYLARIQLLWLLTLIRKRFELRGSAKDYPPLNDEAVIHQETLQHLLTDLDARCADDDKTTCFVSW